MWTRYGTNGTTWSGWTRRFLPGRVTYFYSYGKTNDDNASAYVRWNNAIQDSTGAMNASTGVWTAPVSGYWKIDTTIREGGVNQKYFYKNSSKYDSSAVLYSDNNDIVQYRSMSIVMQLNATDTLAVATESGVNYARVGSTLTIMLIT
jgi:hypothetical protein